MSELPDNYAEVLKEAEFRKKFSSVRFGDMLERVEAVLDGKGRDEFEGWTTEHAKKLKEELDK